ncbi:pyocin activator PrtN family protein [Pseudoalteromonas sp. KG3]|uniref:pyocin activator PrtN family protein n=1 Tax=Pseudoalteromonas sp. KG3 TaxID=2951137 RepID=UPI00265B04E0|nr:pyocin activator PrtN family protein [Pseudoalteromonas sp. KG3]WKD26177.1 pyocin activator PrtN family protein [Pseudoalteromonas sp. KG3]
MNDVEVLTVALESDLLKLHGPIMTGDHLLKALGYASQEALRQSIVRNTVPVPVFKMEKRHGYFVLVKDVANYLAQRRYAIKAGGSYID